MNPIAPTSPPAPQSRAPRITAPDGPAHEWLILPPAALQGALVAMIWRDMRGLPCDDAQRLSHFPASPLLTLSWFPDSEVGLVQQTDQGPRWQPFGASVVIGGSQSRPTASWSPSAGQGGVLCFTPEVARSLLGIDPATVQDRFVPADAILPPHHQPLCAALLKVSAPHELSAVLTEHLAAPWQALHGRQGSGASLRQIGRHWVERLAWQAMEWQRSRSPRQVERRIKAFSGRSLRDWQALVRTEGAFFAARDRHDAGQPFDWADLAATEGFADQAHLVRASRRITGFTPGEFADRFLHDESFWLYRLWV